MDKIDLIQALKDSNHLSKSEAETAINLFFNKAAFFQGGHGIEGSGGWLRLEVFSMNLHVEVLGTETPIKVREGACIYFLSWTILLSGPFRPWLTTTQLMPGI